MENVYYVIYQLELQIVKYVIMTNTVYNVLTLISYLKIRKLAMPAVPTAISATLAHVVTNVILII